HRPDRHWDLDRGAQRLLRGHRQQRVRVGLSGAAVQPAGRDPPVPRAVRLQRQRRHAAADAARQAAGSQAAQRGRRQRPRQATRARAAPAMRARNRELLALIPASLLVTAGFAAIFIQRQDLLSNVSLTSGLLFLALCLGAHIVLRLTLPYADPYLFPLVALLACFGLVMVYRLDATPARHHAQWFVIGLILFAATIVLLRDYLVLERYRYRIALLLLLLLRSLR